MGILRTKTIEPATGSTLTLGASGDTITVSSDSIKANTFKDAGGNTLFTSDGAGTLSSVNSGLAGGGYTLLETADVDGASVTWARFTTLHTRGYDELVFVFTDVNPDNDGVEYQVNFSIDGGANYLAPKTTTFFFAEHGENDSGGAVAYQTARDLAQATGWQDLGVDLGNGADECCAGILHLFNPASTTYVKHFYATVSEYHQNNLAGTCYVSGYLNTTSVITDIALACNSGAHKAYVQMYGIE